MDYEIGVNEPVSLAVKRAVSAVVGREPGALDPLENVLDPAALDTLFESGADGPPRTGGRVSFIYSDCRITVDNGEYLTLSLLEPRLRDSDDRAPSRYRVR